MRRSIVMILGAVLLLSSVASAQRGPRRFARQGARAQTQTEQITVEQRDEIRNLRQEWNKEKAVKQGELKAERIGLQQLLENGEASESDIRSQLEGIAGFDVDIKVGDIALNNSIKGLLSDEQWTRFQRENRRETQNRPGRGGRAFRSGGGPRNRAAVQGRGGNFRGRGPATIRGFRGGRGGNFQGRGPNPGFRRIGGGGNNTPVPPGLRPGPGGGGQTNSSGS